MIELRLPDVGEAEILAWDVETGDIIAKQQTLVSIETDESEEELPSPAAGTVEAILVEEGQTVTPGTPLLRIRPPGDDQPGSS